MMTLLTCVPVCIFPAHLFHAITVDDYPVSSKMRNLTATAVGSVASKVWLYPGTYLVVGQEWDKALMSRLDESLGLKDLASLATLGVDCYPQVTAKAAAIFTFFHLFQLPSTNFKLSQDSPYSDTVRVGHGREIDERTFSHPVLRSFSLKALHLVDN